jgi:hypothetical protein
MSPLFITSAIARSRKCKLSHVSSIFVKRSLTIYAMVFSSLKPNRVSSTIDKSTSYQQSVKIPVLLA